MDNLNSGALKTFYIKIPLTNRNSVLEDEGNIVPKTNVQDV